MGRSSGKEGEEKGREGREGGDAFLFLTEPRHTHPSNQPTDLHSSLMYP